MNLYEHFPPLIYPEKNRIPLDPPIGCPYFRKPPLFVGQLLPFSDPVRKATDRDLCTVAECCYTVYESTVL